MSVKDFDALIAKATKEKRDPVVLGGRTFPINTVPSIVPMLFQRVQAGGYQSSDAILDATIAIMNAELPEGEEPITREWMMKQNIGLVYSDLTDYVLEAYVKNRFRRRQDTPEQ